MTAVFSSIDIGSHTARLLVARTGEPFPSLNPVLRKRTYTRLGQDFVRSGRKGIPDSAVGRIRVALDEFLASTRIHRVEQIYAVATGVFREAENRDDVLETLNRLTGLEIRCLSGEEEALLSSLGTVYALGLKDRPYVIFDLGGGSTEIVVEDIGSRTVESLRLGASVLTGRFFTTDPPALTEIVGLESEIERVLAQAAVRIPGGKTPAVIAGTGGTVCALAAVLQGLGPDDIVPGRINGVRIELERLTEIIESCKKQSLQERMRFSGLDEGRAEVILGGAMVVRAVMHYYGTAVTACMSDLLEGLILTYGGNDERKSNSIGIDI
jgi:exopolyphosphatase / guanosine-5'-triphosphate,3'-diphosphate pyrophosphatase